MASTGPTRPGLVKIAVNPGNLPHPADDVGAAALTHLARLAVACHTNDAVSAHEALDIVDRVWTPRASIVVHA